MHLSLLSHPILSTLASSHGFSPPSANDAHCLFDEMPPRKKRSHEPPVSSPDRIGALPDSILHHMLSFLPAQEAVQTCVLARRWRHLWRYTTGLRINGGLDEDLFQHLRKFVEHLLILRERTDLDTVEIEMGAPIHDDVQYYMNLWIRFAVMCKVRVLKLGTYNTDLCLDDRPLLSRHLRTLDLGYVTLQETFLDLSTCPSLEDFKMDCCNIHADKVSSRSLKHLSITNCFTFFHCRLHVCTPGLVSLNLVCFGGRTPFLENMTLLDTANVELDKECKDVCLNYDSGGVFCGDDNNSCENCVPIKDDCRSDCVLLGGISSAKHLKLLSKTGMLIFTRDLKHCPIFSKLKTLLLNEYWCESPDLDPLACILKNSPLLEKLTLQLFSKGPDHEVEIKGRYGSMERAPTISEHLNIVEVKCNVVDKRILKVLKFLSASNICFSFE